MADILYNEEKTDEELPITEFQKVGEILSGSDIVRSQNFRADLTTVNNFLVVEAVSAKKAVMLLDNGQIALACADTQEAVNRFIGFVEEDILIGQSGSIINVASKITTTGLTTGSIYYLQDAGSQSETITQALDNTDIDPEGQNQTFKATKTLISQVILKLWASGGTKATTIKIRNGTTVLATSNTVDVSAGSPGAEHTFIFSTPAIVSPNTTYNILINSTGVGTLQLRYQNTDVYANGLFSGAATSDIYFKVFEKSGTGNIGTTAGTVSKAVGVAISTTQLLITSF